MEQEIRFCEVDGRRVAYATVGSGPALVVPALWLGHLELEWGTASLRAFLSALARTHTVVRFDRLGSGLSDRDGELDASLDAQVRTVAAVVDALALEELALLGISLGGATAAAFAARHLERVRCVAFVGGFANGAAIAPPELRDALLATVRAHWGAGSRVLADIWLPGAGAEDREAFAAVQRAAADGAVAAALLAEVYRTDVRELLGDVRCPALVVHRRDDRAMPFEQGRELAALLPDARLVALDGDSHLPWIGDADAVLAALTDFFARHRPRPVARASGGGDDEPLSAREREVLRLVAEGLSDAEIAARLILSPHTVHRHVANIRTKLRQPSRAAAAAHAARLGLI